MGGTVHIAVSTLANSGGNAPNGPAITSQAAYTVSGGQITVTVPAMSAAHAYQINVIAGAGSWFDPNHLYEIASSSRGKALEDHDDGTIDGSAVGQWTYSGSDAHKQRKPLDVCDNSTAGGGTVDQWSYRGGSNQLWTVY